MRRIANYIRQVFCKHSLKTEDFTIKYYMRIERHRYLYCYKCGYHSSHEKH
jgi:hypothetical protein